MPLNKYLKNKRFQFSLFEYKVSDPRSLKSSDFLKRKTLFELDSPTGQLTHIAIDWINNLLYYSYFDSPNSYIRVTNFPNIDYHYTIFKSNKDRPSLIAVNPKLRYLYWIDQVSLFSLHSNVLPKKNVDFGFGSRPKETKPQT